MANLTRAALLRSSELKDRRLWFDGTSSFDPDKLLDLIHSFNVEFVDHLTPEVERYNRRLVSAQQFKVKNNCGPIPVEWALPESYQSLDIVQHVAAKHSEILASFPESEWEDREKRLANELRKYKERNLFEVLRAVIYIINTLTDRNIVWGVGRGSSVSSYVLYVIGVHDVDSFAYDLDIDDFLHD